MAKLQLNVNGKERNVEANPQTPLLWILRDHLQLTGTKYGCGKGLCGACTVHIDGVPTRSCVTPAESVQRQQITTIEGLSPSGNHPVQRAWLEQDVPQCGYCQAGQLMSAAWLITFKQNPTDDDINQGMAGNICRCGTYIRIRKAIHRAAELMRESQQKKT